ncbi:hypothetical protein ACS0TY_024644 [Phlomoides rotata]
MEILRKKTLISPGADTIRLDLIFLEINGNFEKEDPGEVDNTEIAPQSGASRSVKVGSCGTRVVAGRIVTESYGTAQQQHTFILEKNFNHGVSI